MIDHADQTGQRVIVVSEYGITPATDAIHINRALRKAGLIQVRPEEFGREILDAGASEAFALSDHQIAHIYVKDPARQAEVKALVEGLDGVEAVWQGDEIAANGLDHDRSGELIAVAKADRWFSYYYWLDDKLAPDFARCVDIHRKPGYDPVELFMDPELTLPKLQAAWKVGKRKLGFRGLLDIISLKDTQIVKGTHGRITDDPDHGPLVISSEAGMMPDGPVEAVDFKKLVLDHVFD